MNRTARAAWLCSTVFLSTAVLLPSDGFSQERSQPRSSDRPAYRPQQVLFRPIRPIVNPKIETAAETDLADNELVIGAVINGQARAWPINQLTGPLREIINDELGGTPVAATW